MTIGPPSGGSGPKNPGYSLQVESLGLGVRHQNSQKSSIQILIPIHNQMLLITLPEEVFVQYVASPNMPLPKASIS